MERTLLMAGVVGVGLWLGSNAVPALWQSWDTWSFDRQVRGEEATVSGYLTEKRRQITSALAGWLDIDAAAPEPVPPAPNRPVRPLVLENNALVGRLTIPRLRVDTTVREGTGEETLALAAGHIRGTALPGSDGNVAVAGHRDTLFRALAGIRKNDLIQFETAQGRYEYHVASIEIVKPHDVSVLKASSHPELTLVTCYPFDYVGSAPERFIVKARQAATVPLSRSLSTLKGAASEETAPGEREPPGETQEPAGPTDPATGTPFFRISRGHSRQLSPGISLGVDDTDAARNRIDGWIWVMPDRRTIWLRDQPAQQPIVFQQNGEKRVVLVTEVTNSSVTGNLLLSGREPAR